MKLTSCLKVIALFSVIALVACGEVEFNSPPDLELYWNDVEASEAGPAIVTGEENKLTLKWKNDLPVSFELSANVKNNAGEWEYVTIPLITNMVGDSITCELDPSYVEIRCTSDNANVDSGYIDITAIYSELPAELTLRATWLWEDAEWHSGIKILLE